MRPVALLAVFSALACHGQSDDEFVGPFQSWMNVKTAYGAKGDGVSIDTGAFNVALMNTGAQGFTHVLWVPCGTYLIDATISLQAKQGASVIGEDPACTTLKWVGPAGGTLLAVNGSNYARVDRITFEGGGTAGVLVEQANTANAFFDTGNQYTDNSFQNAGIGLRCGYMVNGCSEVTILRDHFQSLSTAGIVTGNYNALDLWVRYSVFDHCGIGVGDMTFNPDGSQGFVGAGNFHVYNSIFRFSTHTDIAIGNTSLYSFRDNYSIGSPHFILAGGTGNPAPMTVAGNVILDSTSTPISQNNQGPVVALDNQVRYPGSPSFNVSIDLISVGNTFTTATPYAPAQRLFDAATTIAPVTAAEPVLPGTPPNLHRAIVDVAPGSTTAQIQQAINTAAAMAPASPRPVVHISEGSYTVGPLTLPANTDIQVIGDGFFASQLFWGGGTTGPVLTIAGPTRASLRELYINAGFQVDAIGTYNIDQPGSRVWMHGVQMGGDGGTAAKTNLFLDALSNVLVEAEDIGHSSTPNVGVKVTGGKLNIYSGSSFGETLPYQISVGSLLARDTWNESTGPAYLQVSGRSTVTFDGAHANVSSNVNQSTPAISISNLNGTVTILTSNPQDRAVITGKGRGVQVLQAGGSQDCPVVSPYLVNNTKPKSSTVGLLLNRECTTTTPGVASIPTANFGNNTASFVQAALAQARAAKQAPLAPLPSGVTDLRLYRVSLVRGVNNLHLSNLAGSLH